MSTTTSASSAPSRIAAAYCAADDEAGAALEEASAGADDASAGTDEPPFSTALQSSKLYLALAPLPVTTTMTSVTRSVLTLVSCSSVKPASRYFWPASSIRRLPPSMNTCAWVSCSDGTPGGGLEKAATSASPHQSCLETSSPTVWASAPVVRSAGAKASARLG